MAKSKSSPCVEVGRGTVGESGSQAVVTHQVKSKISKLMVLKTVETSLCPNTGAAAALLVNGSLAAAGIITNPGSSIQAEAPPDAWVVGIVHAFPLFNEIACIRLGELTFVLEECDFVAAETAGGEETGGCVLPCAGVQVRDFYAWIDRMPPRLGEFHIAGEVEVPNPGVDAFLVPRKPKGKKTIAFDLVLVQRPGIWPQVQTWKPVRYDKVIEGPGPTKAEVWCGDETIVDIKVEEVQ
jgi:hypothetical protein